VVTVTPIDTVALCPSAPVIVNAQLPAPAGVTVKIVPVAGNIVAMPVHDPLPLAGDDAVKLVPPI
jgi:hypothetical protein